MKKILSIEISNSNFFDTPITFSFSDRLNCIMGGRGTGKSTLLHFIKSCVDPQAEDESSTYNILRSNLGNGVITLHIQDEEGKKYKIQKSFDEIPQAYKYPETNYIDIDTIKGEISCDIYEAQAIEEIGKNSMGRLTLIDKMIAAEKLPIENDIESLQVELNNNCRQIQSENANLNHFGNALRNFEGAEEELKKLLEEKPEDLNKEEQKQFEEADKNEKIRISEKRYANGITKRINDLEEVVKEMSDSVVSFRALGASNSSFINKDETDRIYDEAKVIIVHFEKMIKEGLVFIQNAKAKIDFIASQLGEKHGIQQNEFNRLKQKFEKHKLFYNKWNALTKRIDEKTNFEKELLGLITKRDKLKLLRKKLVEKLNAKKKELFNLRKQKVEQLNKQFNGSIKITLTYNGITDTYEQSLRNALKGSNMRYNAIVPSIIQNLTPDKFASIVHERDFESLKTITGIDKERSEAIINALFESDHIYQIESLYCSDLPEFLLKIDAKDQHTERSKENYKKSEELSTGQRCTTVLPIVFAVSNSPLIIDQPEDNLDNKYISDTIHEIIKEQKKSRQLIFITHNPNIPVLSDSDHNFFLNYAEKRSKVDVSGTIDQVKNNILNLLEGGKEAFEKRERLYGKMDSNV